MTPLNLPPFEYRLQQEADKTTIFDTIRKKFVVLTPEEWVRQHFVHYLTEHLRYPRTLIGVEVGLRYNRMLRRSDIVVYGRDGAPFMVIECKAATVALSPAVFEQVTVYNQPLRAEYITVTNGLEHYCCRMDYTVSSYAFLKELPKYK